MDGCMDGWMDVRMFLLFLGPLQVPWHSGSFFFAMNVFGTHRFGF